MAEPQLNVAGVTLTQTTDGVELAKNWLFSQKISALDAMQVRDWLLACYPLPKPKECKCQPQ